MVAGRQGLPVLRSRRLQVSLPGHPAGTGANARVYYMRLYGKGASPAHPRVTLIGDNAPLYQEQAIFTPDMKTVIMMSNRAATLGSWYTAVASAAQRTGFDAPGHRLDADASVPGRLRRPGLSRRPLRGRRQDASDPAAHLHQPGHSRVLLERRLHQDHLGPGRRPHRRSAMSAGSAASPGAAPRRA